MTSQLVHLSRATVGYDDTVVLSEIDVTINDPTYYTSTWTAKTNLRLNPDTELFEFICNENEKSTKHMGPNIK